MDPQNINTEQVNAELQQWAETLRKARSEMDQFGTVSAGTAGELNKLQKQAAYNEMWGRKWSIAAGAATSAATSLGSALYKGQTGASAAAGAFNELTTTIGDAVSTLALLHPGGWIRKGLMFLGGQGLKLLGNYVKETAKVSDAFYEAMYRASNSGIITAGGMETLARNMLGLNYGIEEVDKALELFTKNSTGLASFGGTVTRGAERMSEFSDSLRKTNQGAYTELRRILGGPDGVNKRLAVYVTQQSQLGRQSQVTVEGFLDMVKATDALNKAFGITSEGLDAAKEAGRQETRMRALELEYQRKGLTSVFTTIEDQIAAVQANQQLGPDVANQLRALATGAVGSKPFQEAALSLSRIGVDANRIRSDLENQRTTIADVLTQLGKGTKQLTADLGETAIRASEVVEEKFGRLAPGLNAAAMGDFAKKLKDAGKQTGNLSQYSGAAADAQLKTRLENEKTRNTLQSYIYSGIVPATQALEKLATAANKVAGQRTSSFTSGATATGSSTFQTGNMPRKGTGEAQAPVTGAGGAAAPAPEAAASLAKIRDLIGKAESYGGNYNVLAGGQEADLTNMTLEQVLELQKSMKAGIKNGLYPSSAVGKYQIIDSTLRNQIRLMGLDPKTTKFDQATQDRIADDLIVQQGYNKYAAGSWTKERFLASLAGTWAGLPSGPNNKSRYEGKNGNKATIGWNDALASFAKGGISQGPDSGYMAMLHGLEAIVPLANNRSIPVEFRDTRIRDVRPDLSLGKDFTNLNESLTKQYQVLEQQLQKSDAMIQALNRFASGDQMKAMIDKLQNINDKMNTSNDINAKILQVQM